MVLLGPQPDGERQVAAKLAELGVRGPVALITAGWQEYESEDRALRRHLRVPSHNLELHARSEAVFAADPELSVAHKARQTLLRQIQNFDRVRLEAADDAAKAIAVRHVDPSLLEAELAVSIEVFRHLDREHVERCSQVHADYVTRVRPHARPEVARHRAEIARLIGESDAVVIGGGHVASLLSRLHLFGVPALLTQSPDRPVVAWSAGAMALTDRVVCFHDFPPYGKDVAQVLERGLGLAPGVVALPDPRGRVRLDDAEGIGRFARRMAPDRCFGLEAGSALTFAKVPATEDAGAQAGWAQRRAQSVAAPRSITDTQQELAAYKGPALPEPAAAPEPAQPTGNALLLGLDGIVQEGWRR